MLMKMVGRRLISMDRADGWLVDERGPERPGEDGHLPLNITSTIVECPANRRVPDSTHTSW